MSYAQQTVAELQQRYVQLGERKTPQSVRELINRALHAGGYIHLICKNDDERRQASRMFGDKPGFNVGLELDKTLPNFLRIYMADLIGRPARILSWSGRSQEDSSDLPPAA